MHINKTLDKFKMLADAPEAQLIALALNHYATDLARDLKADQAKLPESVQDLVSWNAATAFAMANQIKELTEE